VLVLQRMVIAILNGTKCTLDTQGPPPWLVWDAPDAQTNVVVRGYRLYRGFQSNQEDELLNKDELISTEDRKDYTVLQGYTYYYVVKAVDTIGINEADPIGPDTPLYESGPSNEVSTTIPTDSGQSLLGAMRRIPGKIMNAVLGLFHKNKKATSKPITFLAPPSPERNPSQHKLSAAA
jgi:hypothetical protein